MSEGHEVICTCEGACLKDMKLFVLVRVHMSEGHEVIESLVD